MRIIYVIVACIVVSTACGQEGGKIRLRGQLSDMGSREVALEYSGVSGDFGRSKDRMIYTDGEGRFDTVFCIAEPSYFYISRNILYLSPGDDLTVSLTPDNRKAEFSGRGSAANLFLKDRLFSKGGSFLASGDKVRGDFEETKRVVDSLAGAKLAGLEALEGVSDIFKANERARIKANLLNSYIAYRVYNRENKGKTKEEVQVWGKGFMKEIAPAVNILMREVVRNEFLDVVDVREVLLYNMRNDAFFAGVEVTPEMKEFAEAQELLGRLDISTDSSVVREVERRMAGFRNADVVREMKIKVVGVKSLMEGEPAHDVVMTDMAGNEVLLSSFKGKCIYVDCWATWCGPCIEEGPAFYALSKRFEGRDVVFVQLSTDNSRKAWLDFLKEKKVDLPQYNSVDDEGLRVKWQVKYIPRFILIDKDFQIVRAFAPKPSDPLAGECIDLLLRNK